MDPSTIRRRFYKALAQEVANDPQIPDDLKLHDLRRWFGSMAAAGGIDLVKLMNLMGHSSITTTQLYLHPHRVAGDADALTDALRGPQPKKKHVVNMSNGKGPNLAAGRTSNRLPNSWSQGVGQETS
jgi:hypothetical protein